MNIPIVIRVMPERQEYADYLMRHLPEATYLWDDLPRAMPSLQRASMQFHRALEMVNDSPSLHLEDDVILTQGFREKVQAVIAERPDSVIQFFSMRKDDLTVGSRWDRTFTGTLCVYFPSGYGTQIIDHWHQWPHRHTDLGGFDTALKAWLKSRKERYWIQVPSLVQHRIGVSMMDSRRSSKRQSATFQDPIL